MSAFPPNDPAHVPVLPLETLEALAPEQSETYVDATAGLGGHGAAIASRLGPEGRVLLCDLDASNLIRAEAHVREVTGADAPRIETFQGNFSEIPRVLERLGWTCDMLLADLGFASVQIDSPERGFSFRAEGPLDMRLDPSQPVTAAEIVNTYSDREIARILREFGEESAASRIARKIVESRASNPIETTSELAKIVRGALGQARGAGRSIDPATRTFQALRMAVNDELGNLHSLLASIERAARGASWLAPAARVCFISFHSLEDRPVKRMFRSLASQGYASEPGKQPVRASESEIASNPRSRSSKLRFVTLAEREFVTGGA